MDTQTRLTLKPQWPRWFESLLIAVVTFHLTTTQFVLFKLGLYTGDYFRSLTWAAATFAGLALGALLQSKKNPEGALTKALTLCALWLASALGLATLLFFHESNFISWIAISAIYFLGGSVLARTFALRKTAGVYFADVCGCACAGLAFVLGIGSISVELYFMASLAIFSFGLLIWHRAELKKWALVSIAPAVLSVGLLAFAHSSSFQLSRLVHCDGLRFPMRAYCVPTGTLFYSHDSIGQRIDVYEYKPDFMTVFFDGLTNDAIYPDSVEADRFDPRIIDGLSQNPKFLVIGAAAEGVLKPIKAQTSVDRIRAFELNPAVVRLMQGPAREFSNHAYDGIDLIQGNALSDLISNRETYDVITLLNTHLTNSIGYFGGPDYLHTLETAKLLYDRLNPNGFLILEERDESEVSQSAQARITKTFQQAMRDSGHPDPELGFFKYGWHLKAGAKTRVEDHDYTMTYFKKGLLTDVDRAAIAKWSAHPIDSSLSRLFTLSVDPISTARAETNAPVITNDRPFPWNDSDYMNAFVKAAWPLMIAVVLIAGAALIQLLKKGRTSILQSSCFWLEAFALGLGYFLIELGLVQKISRFTLNPAASYFLVTSGLLFLSGVGSLVSRKLNGFAKALPALLIAALILVPADRAFIEVSIVVAILLGFPFTFLLEDAQASGVAAYLVAANFAAASLAYFVSTALSIEYGLFSVFSVGSAIYVLVFGLSIFRRASLRQV